jgi:6-phosphogluconolactonase
VSAQYVEAAGMWRVTLTPAVINAALNVMFVVAGAGKAERLREVLEGPPGPEVPPARVVRPVHGRLRWLVDAAAASRLEAAR